MKALAPGFYWYYGAYYFGGQEWLIGKLMYEEEQPLFYIPGQPTPVLIDQEPELLKSLTPVTRPKALKNNIPF